MSLLDIHNKPMRLRSSTTRKTKKAVSNSYSNSTPRKRKKSKQELELQKKNLTILRLESLLYIKTQPANISYLFSNKWLKEIKTISNELEQLRKPFNNTPATVGEYFEKHLKK